MSVSGMAQSSENADLTDLSLEDLMKLQVTSVSKKEQSLSRVGAAVYVISQNDIRRSGATRIPDLLRMVPGVEVAQIDANTHAISIRGFNNRLANKVLVLIDGRTVYTPTTSGVYWDMQDVPLEDIERIEVIRGPGGTVWGANAVNGVINIITKNSAETQGGLVTAGVGSQLTGRGLVRYGGKLGRSGNYRVFGNFFRTGNLTTSDGQEAADRWHSSHSGFRSDWNLNDRDTLTVQGDLLQTSEGQTIAVTFSNALPRQATFNDKVTVGAGNLLGRWTRTFADGSDISFQTYYDRYNRVDYGVHETLDTIDFDFSHHVKTGGRHDIVWGSGYRLTRDDHIAGYGKTYVPLKRTNNLLSVFIQDEIALTNSLLLTAGSKLEHNAFTGIEYEPGAQLVWTPAKRHTVWLSAARAIRQPSREEAGLRVDLATFPLQGGGFGLVQLTGDPDRKAEQLRDYEAGYRAQISKRLSLDVASFENHHRNLTTTEPGASFFTTVPSPPHLVSPLVFRNSGRANTRGLETFADWNVSRRLRVSPGWSTIRFNVMQDPSSRDTRISALAANTPLQQFQIRSAVELSRKLDWNTAVYHVGGLRDGGDGAVPPYTRVDAGLTWRASEFVELSINGQNLLRPLHAEFHNAYEVRRTLVQRSGFGKITWQF
jgi:iron complex outermembrane recepter protein